MLDAVKQIDFIERYEGLLTVREIAQELKQTIDEVNAVKREFSSVCWTCKNACNGNRCSWVKRGIYPDGAKTDAEGRIVGCKSYVYDFTD